MSSDMERKMQDVYDAEQTMKPVPENDPLMLAWKKYASSPEYANSERWLVKPEHRKGSMWAAFDAGYHAAMATPMTKTAEQERAPALFQQRNT